MSVAPGFAPPNLFVIGAPRSGTTALYAALKQHPQVFASVLKEPHHYAHDLPDQPHTVRDAGDYRLLFTGADAYATRVEASVWYLYSEAAPMAIAAAHPDARIVALIRDPVRMLVSLYGLYLRTGNESERDPAVALFRETLLHHAHCYFPFGLFYRRLMRLSEAIQRWRLHWPEDRFRICFYEDFYTDPDASFSALCRWLAIDDDVRVHFDSAGNAAVRMLALRQLRGLPSSLRAKLNPQASRLHAGAPPVHVPASVRRRLREEAMDDYTALEALVSRPVPEAWRVMEQLDDIAV